MSSINYSHTWQAPSNIAFVKYWGKEGRQYPKNPSVSMSLSGCFSETKVVAVSGSSDKKVESFLFAGDKNTQFQQRIESFLNSVDDILPFVNDYTFKIESKNSFPHSTGIASSASAFAALSLCLTSLYEDIHKKCDDFYQFASSLARIGSGSACRSVYGGYNLWGEISPMNIGSREYAINVEAKGEFEHLCDDVLIVSDEQKSVLSSAGHSLMNGNIFAEARFHQAKDHAMDILNLFKDGNWEQTGEILEAEALSLHAMMMTSHGGPILLAPSSIALIHKVREFRKMSKIPVFFTIDAGPNIHLIYPFKHKEGVLQWLDANKSLYSSVIHDKLGKGPIKIG